MKFKVKRRHFDAGTFWNVGKVREAERSDVAAQIQSGVLEPVGAKAGGDASPQDAAVSPPRRTKKAKAAD